MLISGPKSAPLTVVLAHGAGAPMDTPFMSFFAEGLAKAGYRAARFEFPYMAARRTTGAKKPPDRQPVLLETWRSAIAELGSDRLVIGGKSMGGRMASLIADDANVQGLVCLGYPFYGAGRKDKPRTEHLLSLKTRALICQGERDPMGGRDSVSRLKLSRAIKVRWLPDGDHDLKPRRASGRTHDENLTDALDAVCEFLAALR
ncbi:MAG: dienelactone hydrolase family protein [Rhodospirillaceae bacterium]|nr:dienelactone hydrolase family protein [Rhodospirillaceae bacterium]